MLTLILSFFIFVAVSSSVVCENDLATFNKRYENQLSKTDFEKIVVRKSRILRNGSPRETINISWNDPDNSTKAAAVKMAVGLSMDALATELNVLNDLHEKGVRLVPTVYACLFTTEINFLIMEYIERSFSPSIRDPKSNSFIPNPVFSYFYDAEPSKRLNYYSQMAAALDGLHKNDYVHHDVKIRNWMLARKSETEFEVRLIDFTAARKEGDGIPAGSVYYSDFYTLSYFRNPDLSPIEREAIGKRTDQKKADLWALAVTIYFLENTLNDKAWDFFEDLGTLMPAQIPLVRKAVTSQEWMKKRGLDICTPDKKTCFYKVIEDMTKIDRNAMTETAESLARQFKSLSEKHVEYKSPVESVSRAAESNQTLLGWIKSNFRNTMQESLSPTTSGSRQIL